MRCGSAAEADIVSNMQEKKQQPAQQASAKVVELKPAEAAKENGNAAFKKGNLQKAIHPSASVCASHNRLTLIAANIARAQVHPFKVNLQEQ